MTAITLKALPTSLHRQLKARAAQNKRSLNREVISVLEDAVAPSKRIDVEAMIAKTRDLRTRLKFTTTPEEIDRFKHEGRE